MFSLPILPEEIRIPLDEVKIQRDGVDVVLCRYPGVVAVARTLGLEDVSRLNDAFPPWGDTPSAAATAMVKQQLIRIEGMKVSSPGAEPVDFDVANPLHMRSIPLDMRSAIHLALKGRATITAVTEKNLESPSGSDGTATTESSPAEAAAEKPATG